MTAIYPTPAHPDLADGREGERARSGTRTNARATL